MEDSQPEEDSVDIFHKLQKLTREKLELDAVAKKVLEERAYELLRQRIGTAGAFHDDPIHLAESIPSCDAQGNQRPVCGCETSDFSADELARGIQTLKKYFPDAEIRKVRTRDGDTAIVFIGMDAATANAALDLEKQKVAAETEIATIKRSIDKMIEAPAGQAGNRRDATLIIPPAKTPPPSAARAQGLISR